MRKRKDVEGAWAPHTPFNDNAGRLLRLQVLLTSAGCQIFDKFGREGRCVSLSLVVSSERSTVSISFSSAVSFQVGLGDAPSRTILTFSSLMRSMMERRGSGRVLKMAIAGY
jgi:hypothetical protein